MTSRHRVHSPQTARVFGVLAADADAWHYGYELGERVGLGSGSLYPILMRLASAACWRRAGSRVRRDGRRAISIG